VLLFNFFYIFFITLIYDFLYQGSEDSERHAAFVWENYVMEANHSRIAIVAHSAGGLITKKLVIVMHKSLQISIKKCYCFARRLILRSSFPIKYLLWLLPTQATPIWMEMILGICERYFQINRYELINCKLEIH